MPLSFAPPKFLWPYIASIVIGFFLLYASTAPRVNIGYADSDELTAVAYNLGVAHPPGYPLYTGLLFIATHLPTPGTVAFKAHLLSALFSSLALGITFYTVWFLMTDVLLTDKNKPKQSIISPQWDSLLIASTSTILLGLSFLYWLYSHITEVFALNNLFIALLLAICIHLIVSGITASTRSLIIAAAIFGLALSHHQTIILLAPMWLPILWLNRSRLTLHLLIRMAASAIAAFIIPYLLIWVYLSQNSGISWYLDPSIKGIVHLIFRKEFTGLIPETGEYTNAYLPPISLPQIIKVMPTYIKYFITFFGYMAAITSLIGAKQLIEAKPLLGSSLLIVYIICGPFFAGLIGWPENVGLQAASHRFYLMGYMFTPLLMAGGWYVILQRIRLTVSILFNKKLLAIAIPLCIVIATIGFRLYTQYPLVNLRHFTLVSSRYSAMIEALEPNAVIACFSDTSCFALLYEQYVNHRRPDVIVIPRAYPLMRQKLDATPNLKGFQYPDNPYLTLDYLTWNIGQRPVYVTDLSELYYRLLGINEGFIYYVPHGYYGQLLTSVPAQQPELKYTPDEALIEDIPTQDLMRLWFKGNTIRTHIFNSVILVKSGYRDTVLSELNRASNLQTQLPPEFGSLESTRRNIEQSQPDDIFKPGRTAMPLAEYTKLVNQWTEKQRYDVAYRVALGAADVYPRDIASRIQLAASYEKLGDKTLARMEYKHALLLDPNNELAKQKVAELSK